MMAFLCSCRLRPILIGLALWNVGLCAAFTSLGGNDVGLVPRRYSSHGRASAFTILSSSSDDSGVGLSRIGIFGGGTVGGGIVEILQNKRDYLTSLSGKHIEVAKICVRDATKKRDFDVPEGCTVVTDYDDILDDPSIDIVVEVMGGIDDAKKVIFKALRNGKGVVTANKALIAAHLKEIEDCLVSTDMETGDFRYEAAVCGGIPVIRSMLSDFVGDDVKMMSGIINGCTNYMLTAMDRRGQTYDEALEGASALGYAEADPTLDVGGYDARSKLKILMRLAYGIDVPEDEIGCRGITELTKVDFEYAKMLGGTIKLVGVARKLDDNRLAAFVSPTYISTDDPLSSVNGATNAIEIISSNLVQSTYIGQGAGRFPTANSCVNDIVALAKGERLALPFNPTAPSSLKYVNDFDSTFFVRLRYRDMLGITKQCGEICERYGVSIHSIMQNPTTSRGDAAFVLVTERVPLSSIKKACVEIEALDWCKGQAFYMPILREDWVTPP